MTADEFRVLQLLRLARLVDMPRYPDGPEADHQLALKRVQRQGLGYFERVILQIIHWTEADLTIAEIEANVLAEVQRQRYIPEPPERVGAPRAGKISAARKAANTAALLAALKAGGNNE